MAVVFLSMDPGEASASGLGWWQGRPGLREAFLGCVGMVEAQRWSGSPILSTAREVVASGRMAVGPHITS